MDGSSNDDYGTSGMSSPTEGRSAGQRCQSIDSLAEWRSSEQLENGTPSTSPPFWDTDDDDDDCGPRPSELHGKFTWKIENYSQINKRELRSNAFEVGGYKWYILIYPQGCDVCNHLSLFLCVANHDKLLPGWSHFAQFTIAVVNKDPKKSKFSDTLHRFWKKEHDWGWKKFMELSKVEEGFVNSETLVIKAQVQVIREKAHRPFRCLDCQYRRELVRVYLSNVEQICRRFFEDRKNKLSKLIEDKLRWASFCGFWFGIDQNSRRRISRDKLDTILRVVVKQFFVEKEVTSTLVMDSLYSGLKSLESQSKNKKEGMKVEIEDSPAPMVLVEKDMFVLADDILLLLERVASEPLPAISVPPKDDKISQNRTKEGSFADEYKDTIQRDERRLTELGRRTVEIFVLSHIFSSIIEVAYQEAVALKRQEELIREEEAAGQAEHELKAKRVTAEKDKRTKKKQGKQRRNNRKSKEKQRELKYDSAFNEKKQEEKCLDEIVSVELSAKSGNVMSEKREALDDASDASYNGDDAAEPLYPDLEDRDSNPLNSDTDASEPHTSMEVRSTETSNYQPEKVNIGMDDSSSTCSTDSNGAIYKGHALLLQGIRTSHNQQNKINDGKIMQNQPSFESQSGEVLDSSPSTCPELDGDAASQKHSMQWHEKHQNQKHESAAIGPKKISKDRSDAARPSIVKAVESSSASLEPARKMQQPVLPHAKQSVQNTATATKVMTASVTLSSPIKEPPPSSSLSVPKRSAALSAKSQPSSTIPRSEAQKPFATPSAKTTPVQPVVAISRPSSAPLIPVASRSKPPAVSTVQVMPFLSRSASATGRLVMDPSLSAPSYVPQSYRNAIIGRTAPGSASAAGFVPSTSSLSQESTSSSQSSTSSTSCLFPPPMRREQQITSRPGFIFGSVKPEALHIQQQQRDHNSHIPTISGSITTTIPTPTARLCPSTLVVGIEQHQKEVTSSASSSQPHVGMADEFPHLDIINDLLDEEQSIMGMTASIYHPHHHPLPVFSRQYSFPGDPTSSEFPRYDHSDRYYDDAFQSFQRMQEGHFSQAELSAAYANCQMDGLMQRQWPFSLADLEGASGYSYHHHHLSDYPNTGNGLNGYGLFHP